MSAPPHILHLHSTFSLGGKEARAVRLMNAFGGNARHSIVSAMPEEMSAREAIDSGIMVDYPGHAPSLQGKPGIRRYRALARYMRQFDLILTYNWGAMDAVMAHRMGGIGLPPIIHHEDGFNADEADRLKTKRSIFRRFAFPTLHRLVVPSERLKHIALNIWHQPPAKLAHIPNGIAVPRYGGAPEPDAIPGFERRPGEIIIGTVAGLRAVKDIPRLVRALAKLPQNVRLVVAGEGPDRIHIAAEAEKLGIADRLYLPGFLDRPWRYIGHFDIFALSSRSEQFPISVVEAMAAGLPVVSPDVGDVRSMVSEANRPLIVDRNADLADPLRMLIEDAPMGRAIGVENRAKAEQIFDEEAMIAAYSDLYSGAMERPDLLTRE